MTESPDVAPPLDHYDIDVDTLIIGAGAAGMVAALARRVRTSC